MVRVSMCIRFLFFSSYIFHRMLSFDLFRHCIDACSGCSHHRVFANFTLKKCRDRYFSKKRWLNSLATWKIYPEFQQSWSNAHHSHGFSIQFRMLLMLDAVAGFFLGLFFLFFAFWFCRIPKLSRYKSSKIDSKIVCLFAFSLFSSFAWMNKWFLKTHSINFACHYSFKLWKSQSIRKKVWNVLFCVFCRFFLVWIEIASIES